MTFTVDVPAGWTRSPFPAPQRGLYLHPPPGGPRAAILLMDALTPAGTVAEQLAAAVRTGCAGAELLAEGAPIAVAGTFAGLSVVTRVRVSHQTRVREELRVFTLLDAGDVRLPIVFLGELGSAHTYQLAIGQVLTSVRRDAP